MGHNNSANQDYQNNADGAQLGGGVIKRILKWLGGDITLTGANSNTYTFPASDDTLVGRNSADTLTNKTIDAANNTIRNLDASTLAESAVPPDKLATHLAGGSLTISATGNMSITGVGFKPQGVEFWFRPGTSSGPAYYGHGTMLASGFEETTSSYASTTATYRYDSLTECLSFSNNTGVQAKAKFVSMDADGFTINVTLAGGSTFSWLAFG